MSDMPSDKANAVPIPADIPDVAPGCVRLIGSKPAMDGIADKLEVLHAALHSRNERLRKTAVQRLEQRGIRVVYGAPLQLASESVH